MKKERAELRLAGLSSAENEKWKKFVLEAQKKKIPLKEANILFLFQKDIKILENLENPVSRIKGFLLFQTDYCLEINSETGINKLREMTSEFLGNNLYELFEYAENLEDRERVLQVLEIFFLSKDFRDEYDWVFNEKIEIINTEIVSRFLCFLEQAMTIQQQEDLNTKRR